jgi:succinate-acetate transporter protein
MYFHFGSRKEQIIFTHVRLKWREVVYDGSDLIRERLPLNMATQLCIFEVFTILFIYCSVKSKDSRKRLLEDDSDEEDLNI